MVQAKRIYILMIIAQGAHNLVEEEKRVNNGMRRMKSSHKYCEYSHKYSQVLHRTVALNWYQGLSTVCKICFALHIILTMEATLCSNIMNAI